MAISQVGSSYIALDVEASEDNDKIDLFGMRLDNLTIADAIEKITSSIENREFCYAVTPNVDHVVKLRHDERFRATYRNARFVFADGVPLLWAAAILGRPMKGRINGTDLFERLCEIAEQRKYRVFLLGGNPGTAEAAANALIRRHPGLIVAGWECPQYGFDKNPQECRVIQNRIATVGADLLFVGLGAPKQEEWILQYGKGAGVSFAVGIGISFSFVAGQIRRAPMWMRGSGLEWTWRLFSEPTRLWRRYLLQDMAFIPLFFREWMRQMSSRRERSKCRLGQE